MLITIIKNKFLFSSGSNIFSSSFKKNIYNQYNISFIKEGKGIYSFLEKDKSLASGSITVRDMDTSIIINSRAVPKSVKEIFSFFSEIKKQNTYISNIYIGTIINRTTGMGKMSGWSTSWRFAPVCFYSDKICPQDEVWIIKQFAGEKSDANYLWEYFNEYNCALLCNSKQQATEVILKYKFDNNFKNIINSLLNNSMFNDSVETNKVIQSNKLVDVSFIHKDKKIKICGHVSNNSFIVYQNSLALFNQINN